MHIYGHFRPLLCTVSGENEPSLKPNQPTQSTSGESEMEEEENESTVPWYLSQMRLVALVVGLVALVASVWLLYHWNKGIVKIYA